MVMAGFFHVLDELRTRILLGFATACCDAPTSRTDIFR